MVKGLVNLLSDFVLFIEVLRIIVVDVLWMMFIYGMFVWDWESGILSGDDEDELKMEWRLA